MWASDGEADNAQPRIDSFYPAVAQTTPAEPPRAADQDNFSSAAQSLTSTAAARLGQQHGRRGRGGNALEGSPTRCREAAPHRRPGRQQPRLRCRSCARHHRRDAEPWRRAVGRDCSQHPRP